MNQPSRTAQEVALYRAAHQILDRPLVFDDPLALPIVGQAGETTLRSNQQGLRVDPQIRALIAARSRFAEDELARAGERGVRQIVILGAGLDTFAYRNPHLRTFEADHPATQTWKRQRLSESRIPRPPSLSFVPLDFATQKLAGALAAADFKCDQPAFFSMLGLVIFLPETIVLEILKFVATLPAGSGIVFDYGVLGSSLTDAQRQVRQRAAQQSAALGEPFVTFFDPPALASELRRLGFKQIDDLGWKETNLRYFQNRSDNLSVGISGRRLISAWF